ncbi:MAG TPA: hypothetical protein VMX77_00085 [Candidatus Bathyarchaeia archaeon]|nr:hypothetical protein [Candidatus Bathyarchaeia archaeon]
MEELSQANIVFDIYPRREEMERRDDFTLYDIGEGYLGAGQLNQTEENVAQGILLAYDKDGDLVFRGGLDYHHGRAALGQTSGSFQRAREHKGHRIGRKMAVVGLNVLENLISQEDLPLEGIGVKTKPDSSMAKIAEFIGMNDEEGKGLYQMTAFPETEELMDQLGIKKLE